MTDNQKPDLHAGQPVWLRRLIYGYQRGQKCIVISVCANGWIAIKPQGPHRPTFLVADKDLSTVPVKMTSARRATPRGKAGGFGHSSIPSRTATKRRRTRLRSVAGITIRSSGTGTPTPRPLEDEEYIRAHRAQREAKRIRMAQRKKAREAGVIRQDPTPPKVKQRRTEYHDETRRSVPMTFNNVGRGKRSR